MFPIRSKLYQPSVDKILANTVQQKVEVVEAANETLANAATTKQVDMYSMIRHDLPCTLHSSPAPMILMSLGRSGTASMYQVLSQLSGNETPRIIEYTGRAQ